MSYSDLPTGKVIRHANNIFTILSLSFEGQAADFRYVVKSFNRLHQQDFHVGHMTSAIRNHSQHSLNRHGIFPKPDRQSRLKKSIQNIIYTWGTSYQDNLA